MLLLLIAVLVVVVVETENRLLRQQWLESTTSIAVIKNANIYNRTTDRQNFYLIDWGLDEEGFVECLLDTGRDDDDGRDVRDVLEEVGLDTADGSFVSSVSERGESVKKKIFLPRINPVGRSGQRLWTLDSL